MSVSFRNLFMKFHFQGFSCYYLQCKIRRMYNRNDAFWNSSWVLTAESVIAVLIYSSIQDVAWASCGRIMLEFFLNSFYWIFYFLHCLADFIIHTSSLTLGRAQKTTACFSLVLLVLSGVSEDKLGVFLDSFLQWMKSIRYVL